MYILLESKVRKNSCIKSYADINWEFLDCLPIIQQPFSLIINDNVHSRQLIAISTFCQHIQIGLCLSGRLNLLYRQHTLETNWDGQMTRTKHIVTKIRSFPSRPSFTLPGICEHYNHEIIRRCRSTNSKLAHSLSILLGLLGSLLRVNGQQQENRPVACTPS